MCGIWFSAGQLGAEEKLVAHRALDLVRHRGPDGEGIWKGRDSPPVVLGHRRLSIIAPGELGDQPMLSADGRYAITFNGEIYNYRDFLAELHREGIPLRSNSDTEVLLELLVRRGLGILRELQGFFAFVFFDRLSGRFFAARDRFGIKPLYFRAVPGAIAFASEIKQFLALPGFRAHLDSDAVGEYLSFNLFNHGDGTFFRGVSQVEPGCFVEMTLDQLGDAYARQSAWTPIREDEVAPDSSDLSAVRPALEAAVSKALISDVPIGFALSGGIDSATVSSIAALKSCSPSVPLRAFGIFFPDDAIAEATYARAVAEKSGIKLTELTIHPEELEELFCATLWCFDEPVLRGSMLAHVKLYRAFRASGIRVVLGGQGGDELFCGYHSAWPSLLLDLWEADGSKPMLERAAEVPEWLRCIWTETFPLAQLQQILQDAKRKLSPSQAKLADTFDWDVAFSRLCRGRIARQPLSGATRSARWSQRVIGANSLTMNLHYDDRASMASGVESRPALLDLELVRVALSLPIRDKIADGQLKGAVRMAMHDILPPLVRDRRSKLGFAVPEEKWQEAPFGGFLLEQAKAGLDQFETELASALDVPEMRDRLKKRRFHGTPVWFLASLGVWASRFQEFAKFDNY